MEIKIIQENEPLIIELTGRLDASNSSDFDKRINEVFSNGIKNIALNLKYLTYISSAGLRIFMLILNNCTEAGKKFALISPDEMVAEVISISGLSDLIPSFTERDEAIKYLVSCD
jgi:anti-anti-sigma factor